MLTKHQTVISSSMLIKYFKTLKNRIYKCLPMYEEQSTTLDVYVNNLLYEMLGGADTFGEDLFIELVNKLAYVNRLETHEEYKRQIFDCLSVCDKMIKRLEG